MSLSDKIYFIAFTYRFYAIYAVIVLQMISYITKNAVDGFHLSKTGGRFFYYSSVLIAALPIIFIGLTDTAVRAVVFGLALLYAAVSDAKTHECTDVIPMLFLVVACIGMPMETVLGRMICGLIFWVVLLVISAVFPVFFNTDSIGGADIKFVGACTAVVGGKASACAFIASLFIAVLVNSVFRKKKKAIQADDTEKLDSAQTEQKIATAMAEIEDGVDGNATENDEAQEQVQSTNADGYALLPYIAAGYAAVYIVNLIFPTFDWLGFLG